MEMETNGTANDTNQSLKDPNDNIMSGRLPTFKVPRNLTLSGIRGTGTGAGPTRTKHVFVPNIPVRRITSSKASDFDQADESSSGSQTRDTNNKKKKDKTGRSERKSKEKPILVQSQSIFGEGVGDGSGRGIRRSNLGSSSTSGFTRSMGSDDKGSANIKARKDKLVLDRSEDDEGSCNGMLNDIIGDGISETGDGVEDFALQPVHLPLAHCLEKMRNVSVPTQEPPAPPIPVPSLTNGTLDMDIPPNLKIKVEPGLEPAPQPQPYLPVPALPFAIGIPGFRSFAQVVTAQDSETSNPGLMFLQLPDLVPLASATKNGDMVSLDPKTANAKGTSNLSSLPDGCIGKVQVLASGKTRLVIGDNYFDITPAKETAFQQEIVTIDTEEQAIGFLGQVQQKFLCTPDLEIMLNNVQL